MINCKDIKLLLDYSTHFSHDSHYHAKSIKKKNDLLYCITNNLKYFFIPSVTGTVPLSLLCTVVNRNNETQFL